MKKSTYSLIALLALPFIIMMQIGSIETIVIVIMGFIYVFVAIYILIEAIDKEDKDEKKEKKTQKEDDNILNHAYKMLSEGNEKKLYIGSLANKVGLSKNRVNSAIEIFKRQQKIPYDVELIQDTTLESDG